MGIAERKEREKKEMKEKILLSARRLFIRDGFENVTIRKIADDIEYSPTTIYLYFRDKDEIFFQLYKDAFDEFYRYQLKTANIADPVTRLRTLGEYYFSFAIENPEYYDLMFISVIPMKPLECGFETEHPGKKTFEYLLNTVKECQKSGLFKEYSPEAAALFVWSTVHGLVSLNLKKRMMQFPPEKTESVMREVLEIIIHR
ncbi:MAG: TetR/AcrR family transcriptional regulator [Ignavibacteriaceae bacterium]|nr:TetR/AcrR family transcriptional regulator [Ignavibacteriaceae bacterium]